MLEFFLLSVHLLLSEFFYKSVRWIHHFRIKMTEQLWQNHLHLLSFSWMRKNLFFSNRKKNMKLCTGNELV